MTELFGAERAAAIEDFQSRALQLNAGQALTEPDYRPISQPDRTMWLRAAPVVSDSGTKSGVVTIAVDVSNLKNAERNLRESEALLQSMLDHIPGVVGMRGIDSSYLVLGGGCEDWYCMPREEMLGKRPTDIWSEEAGQQIIMEDQDLLKHDAPSILEDRFQFPDGISRFLRVNRFPIHNEDGSIKGIGFLVNDISAEKRAEEQLRQAQKMEAVGQLTGGIAHDFNNLLGIIIGNLDFLEEGLKGNTDLHKITISAMTAALQGAALNKQLLAFSRKQELAPRPLDLNARITDMLTMLQRSLPESIEIHAASSPDLWLCVADASQVESALLNLVLNARDAMPDGGQLKIETANCCIDVDDESPENDPASREYAVLSVSDTGTGMTTYAIEHAFEPFFTTKPVGQGSGLGLSMIYGFAKQSDGHVTIDSEPGRGTTVRLYLPRHITPTLDTTSKPETGQLAQVGTGA